MREIDELARESSADSVGVLKTRVLDKREYEKELTRLQVELVRLQEWINPAKRWKLSPVDVEARARWVDYAEAKDEMFAQTDTEDSPWFVVEADDKRTARLKPDRPPARTDPLRARRSEPDRVPAPPRARLRPPPT